MAASQQHALTNTSCTFPASPAVFASSGNYGGGQTASCSDLHDRLSGISNCEIQSVVYSSAAAVSQPILGHTASRKTKPCSLCGTAAQRSQSCVVSNSPISPQEQPVVLLHRLEDGLPEGDVDSLRAFGTIRLLPVHRRCGKAEVDTNDNKNEGDRKCQSLGSDSMSPGSLFYKSIKRGSVKKRTEAPARIHSFSDPGDSLRREAKQNYIDSDNYCQPCEKTEIELKKVTNVVKLQTDNKGTISHSANTPKELKSVTNVVKLQTDKVTLRQSANTEAENVCENSTSSKLNIGQEVISAHVKAAPDQSRASLVSQPSQCLFDAQQCRSSSSVAESLNRSASTRSIDSNDSPSPQTSTSSITATHSQTRTSQSPCDTNHSATSSSSPSTPMSVVCSPVVQLPNTTLSSSPSQNISSPSAISPPESPPSPTAAFLPPLMGSPVACDRETEHAACPVDIQPSSPYSPCSAPSLPASPASLPSSSDSPPSPAPSLESPPASPVASSDYQRVSHKQAHHPCTERPDNHSPSDTSVCEVESDTVLQSKVKIEQRKVRDHKVGLHCHPNQSSSMENAAVPANKSSTDQRLATQVPTPSTVVRSPSSNSQNRDAKTLVDSYAETSNVCVSGEKKENEAETKQVSQDLAKCFMNIESGSADLEKSSCDYKNSQMKLVLKVKHPGSQQTQSGSEKKENKESGIPKIILTLTGKGPNKEYSCSNRTRHDNENSSENNKKHKSKRNKRLKPKEREKTKKIVKGDKHKRHLELFGEDSNDSCDIDFDSSGDHQGERRHSRTPSLEEQEIPQFTEPLSPEESVFVSGERDFPPPVHGRESSSGGVSGENNRKIRTEEHTKNKDPSADLVDEPSLLSFSQVKSDNLVTNETLKNSAKDLPLAEENKETPEGQAQPIEINMKECIREADEALESCDKEPSYVETENTVETLTSAGMLHPSDVSHPSKQPDDFILRSQKSRHAKNTESGRNSDACLWVSFGVHAPLPLPNIDAPSLKSIFTSKEKTKQRGSVSSESKRTLSADEPSISVTEKSISKPSHKDHKDREKIGAVSEVTKESKERITEEKTKPSAEYDHKHDFYSTYRSHSSSSHGERSHVLSRVRSKGEFVHHRHRHSHKRLRKSDEGRERMVKKEEPSSHQNSCKPTHKDDFRSQKVSINNSHSEKLPPVKAQMQATEKHSSNTPSACPTVSPVTGDGLPVQQVPTDPHPQSLENAISNNTNKEFDNIAKPNHAEEYPEKQYYRPKKIRKICHFSTTRDQCNENKSLEPMEDEKAHGSQSEVSTPISHKNSDSFQYFVETAAAPLGPHVAEPEPPTAESDASIIQTAAYWKLHEDSTNTEKQPTTPQDAETVHEHRKRKHRSPTPQEQEPVARTEEEHEEQTQPPTSEEKETVAGKQEDIKTDSILENEENEKEEIEKREKERRKKSSRREKRRDFSSAGSKCSVLQEVQHRREVEHEEERGRRLAQEIKGFNWLEQKIKNSSLLSSVSSPATPTASPVTKEAEPASRTLSAPAAAPPTRLTNGSRDEGVAKKKILSASGGSTGLKGHLQTAVPPLIPSSKVTALPKRRQSLSISTTPPCSASSAISSVTTVPSMTVQGALYTCEPTPNRSEHGRVGSTLENSNIGFEHGHSVHNKATLYSSITSSKATLYGVKDNNLEAFYDTVGGRSTDYNGGVNTGSTDTQYSITTTPTISFYGSAKYQQSDIHSQKSFSTGSSFNSSVISSQGSFNTLREHQHNLLHSPKSNTADWAIKQELSLNDSSKSTGSSVDSHSSQQFSHKQTLLRRAFQEMLKSEPNSSSPEQSKESQDLAETEMKKADALKCKETEVGINLTHLSSGSTSVANNINKNFITNFPDSTPLCPANKSSDVTDNSSSLYAQESVTPTVNQSKELIESVHDEDKKSSPVTDKKETSENITCNLDSNQTQLSENCHDGKGEDEKNCETSGKSVSDTENVKSAEDHKDLQTNIINSIVSDSGVINVKVLKDDLVSKTDDKNKEDPEVQPNLLLSVLYKELLKTRKEVEKLRKVQELMLTEKGDKKEDISEQNTDDNAKSDKTDENANTNEKVSEKRKGEDESYDTEFKTDDEFYQESKRSKISTISIRNDLLPKEECMALNDTVSCTSAPQKNISQPQQAPSPTLASPTVIQSATEVPVITLESSAMPEASHLSRASPAITTATPALSDSTSGPPKVSSASPRGHLRTSPGISSPGVSRASSGAPRTSPAPPRASPGVPLSNISPGLSISPGLPSSPGLQNSSPGIPRSSPGVLRMSPVRARTSSGMLRESPGVPVISPGNSGLGSIKNAAEVISVSPGVSQTIPASTQSNIFNPPTNTSSTDNLPVTHCHLVTALVQPKVTTVQSIASPAVPIPGFPQTPVTSSAKPITSPPAVRVSPHISRIDTTASKTDTALTNMSPTKLRSVFGISSSEVELMPIPAGGSKYSHHEPQPQTYIKAIEDNHHQINETPLLMNAVRGIHREIISKESEPPTNHGPMSFHSLPCPDDSRRTLKTHQYETGVKRHAFSTSDLPDHPASVCKQPPPLKPVSALLRRHSDNLDIHSLMHHQAMYPPHKNLTNSLHPSTSTAEHRSAESVHPFHQNSCAPPQYPMSGPSRRRSSDSSSSERTQEYQQSVSMGMQHQYPHLASGASVMRSLGPDKASIFPIPPAMPPVIRPFKPTTPPTVVRAQREHYQNENFYRSHFSFFEKLREKFVTSGDSGVNRMERLQPPVANVEKPIQPQTFAPRVLVRESLPEAPTQIPTTYSTLHFQNPNQPMPNVMPSHQNHFSSNVHTGSAIHQAMAQARMHPNANQAISNTQRNTTGSGGEKLCFRCSQPARFVCSGCKKAWYCSEHCQREDWSSHGGACAL